MNTRRHIHQESFTVSCTELFQLLITPSAIRHWWQANRVIIMPRTGGIWSAAWGDDEDRPDYITSARIQTYDPPRVLILDRYQYFAHSGPLPFMADFVTTFEVFADQSDSVGQRSVLRVIQDGFPMGAKADAFYTACEQGWKETFQGIRRYLQQA